MAAKLYFLADFHRSYSSHDWFNAVFTDFEVSEEYFDRHWEATEICENLPVDAKDKDQPFPKTTLDLVKPCARLNVARWIIERLS